MFIKSNNFHFSSICLAYLMVGLLEVLVTVGGEDDKVVSRSVDCFDPKGKIWLKLESLPLAVSKHGLVVSGKFLHILGLSKVETNFSPELAIAHDNGQN